jgi:predicted Zn-dependent protease with MMP-like domain
MIHVSEQVFQRLVEESVSGIPERFKSHLDNVAFLVADEPTRAQLSAGGILHNGMTLLGLYEGTPLPRRMNGYNGATPDVITIFKKPHEASTHDLEGLRLKIHETVWHEVAHYFGLDHGQIQALEHH